VYEKCYWCAQYLKDNADSLIGLERDILVKIIAEIPVL